MSKTYQLKMTSAKAEAKTHDATPANGKAPTTLQAQAGARYQLSDVKTGFAPDNIRVSRSGKHLKIFVDGVSEPAFVIENFYEFPIEDRLVLSGKAEDGSAYAYTPETASSAATVAQLKDDGLVAGMALGGEGNAAGAAVGLLAPVAAFNPLLLAAGALGAAAAAGGGGGGDGASSPTNNTAAKVSIEGITQDTGSSSQDFYTSDNTLTYTGKIAGYVSNGDVLKLELKNSKGEVIATETVTPKSDGTWSWIALDSNQAPRVLADGNYTLIATLVDKTGKQVNSGSDGQDTQIITIDTASDKNTDPSGADNTPSVDPNTLAAVEIKAITDDTGVSATDFYTADNTLTYTGKINGYTANDDVIKLELRNSKNETLTTSYAKPLADGQWTWQDLDATGKAVYRADGNYSLVATLVDKAGNRVNAGSSGSATQTITIDTSTIQNTDSSKLDNIPSDDTNRLASIAIASITDDTGQSQTDFYTADNTLSYSGTLKDFSTNGDAVCLILKDIAGKVLSTNYVTPTNTNWTWVDSVARADGIYSLEANIVDKAGNVLAKAAAKTIHIDTSTTQNTNGQDPNADLTLDITGLVLSANGLRTGLADFYNNAPDQSRFKGTFSGNWVSNNDRLVLEIFDPQTGKQLAAETITPSGNTWTSSNQFLGSRANGTYVLRATVEDQAGNTVMVDTQSFVIDKNLIAQDSIIFKPLNSDVVVTLPEGGKLTLTGQMTGKPYTYDYSGTALDLQQQLSNEAFTYTFTDYAGNTFSNGSTGSSSWSGPVKVAASTSISAADVQTSLTGDIGTYSLSTNATTLNLSAVIASKGTSAFNSIDLTGNGITSLTIKAHDLLDIGLTNCFIMGSNSFSKDQKYDSDIQFKVKGDSSDIINMTELTNTGSKVTLADGQSYAVYHTIVGSIDIDVFVLDGMKVN